jgi:hypothetical protein
MSDDTPDVEFDPDHGTYRAAYGWDRSEPLSTWVVEVVTQVKGCESSALTPLYYSVDPDALDRLFAARPDGTARAAGSVSFELDEYEVTVDASGDVTVRPP